MGTNCTVRGFGHDNILTDCYISRGMSGGPLLVQTRSGVWKIAGICSEQYMLDDDHMIIGGKYSNYTGNVFSNVTLYRSRILAHIGE